MCILINILCNSFSIKVVNAEVLTHLVHRSGTFTDLLQGLGVYGNWQKNEM